MRRTNHFLPVRQIERLDAFAEKSGLDRSAIIRLAIDDWLDREERKAAKREEGR